VARVSDLGLKHLYSGKVRDLYEVDGEHLLMVASDRMSAYDVVMNEPVPQKGRVLTGLTHYWTQEFASEIRSALVSCDPEVVNGFVEGFRDDDALHGRTMLVRRATMLPLECIVRARLAGQAFDEYVEKGTVHGISVPSGMRLTDAFVNPIFTPSTKAASGHDLNIDLTTAADALSSCRLGLGIEEAGPIGRGGRAPTCDRLERGLVIGVRPGQFGVQGSPGVDD